MKPDALCAAVREPRRWLEQFRLKTYAQAFRDYGEAYGPLYQAELLERGEDESALTALAVELLDTLEADWKRQHFWNRAAAKADTKQMLVDYLSPMLLGLDTPGAQSFCRLLRDQWTARWPKDSYLVASAEMIQRGFKNAIMGIEIQSKKPERPKDFFES